MINRRKALIGYAVYTVGKMLVKLKLRKEPTKKKKIAGGAALAAGATLGGIVFWRKRRGSPESPG